MSSIFKRLYNLNPRSYFNIWGDQNKDTSLFSVNPFDFQRSLKKAVSGGYQGVLLDEQLFMEKKDLEFYIKEILKSNLIPVLQITSAGFANYKTTLLQMDREYKKSLFFNIIFEDIQTLPVQDIKPLLPRTIFTYVVTKRNRNIAFKKKLPRKVLKKTELYFPYKIHFSDPFLTPRQVYNFLKKYGPVRACQSEIYDHRIARDMELEPCTEPFAENQIPSHGKDILFSIIIPSYNNRDQIVNTLKYLSLQDYPRWSYEVIIVVDGSSDNTKQAIKSFMERHLALNLKAIYFPRVIEPSAGEPRFRAGIARNLGVKYSRGKILAFLDADILIPPHYLSSLQKEHEKADVVLLKRYHLKPKVSIEELSFDFKRMEPWCYIEDKHYWGNFYKKGFNQVKSPWKYICTYGLSLLREDFHAVGRFGKNFVFYGFEDTDLGWRLFKKKKKFLLSDIEVYHQPPPFEQKKFSQNPLFRYRQLSKTAKIFFYRNLDPEIYEELSTYMSQNRGLSYFFPIFSKRDIFLNS